MKGAYRKLAYVLAAENHGTMIVNRLDYRMTSETEGYGVGFSVLETGSHAGEEVNFLASLLALRRQYHGDGVFAVDCGANIGVHTVAWARAMSGWGSVLAIEAQERVFYALAGNIALNNCFNAHAVHAAVAARDGTMSIPCPDYLRPASFGSLELRSRDNNEFIGQAIDYISDGCQTIRCVALDSMGLARIDLIKIDVEGMEEEVLEGAHRIIAAQHPILFVEWIKSAKPRLRQSLESEGYSVSEVGINLLAIHKDDRTLSHVHAASGAAAPQH